MATPLSMRFQVTAKHYVSPIFYRTKSKKESKAYILLFTCSLCRAAHLELTKNLTSKEFTKFFERLTARRGRPKLIFSENLITFQSAIKWLSRRLSRSTYNLVKSLG